MKHVRGRSARTALAVVGATAALATSACSIDVKNIKANPGRSSRGGSK